MSLRICLILCLLAAFPCLTIAQSRELIVNIQFDTQLSSNVLVTPATLKYNKEFAYSFTFDDASKDAYNLGFRLLNGGLGIVDNNTYPGLFYTEDCVNLLPFRAGISWYTANDESVDLHFVTPGTLTYDNAKVLFSAGWDFFNHSYNHASHLTNAEYEWQLSENSWIFKANTGIRFNICVPPDGDTGYINPAFEQGLLACITSNGAEIGKDFVVDVTIPVPPEPVYWRRDLNSDDYTLTSLKSNFDQWVATAGIGKQKWWNEYTHRVQYEHYAGSLEFPVFREYFEYMEQKYGRPGKDNGWFTGSGEVLDYLLVRDKVAIHKEIEGSTLRIHLDYTNVPETLRHFDLSLLLKNAGNIQSVSSASPLVFTHAKTANGLLININVPDSFYSGIDEIVTAPAALIFAYPNPTNGTINLKIPDGTTDPSILISDMKSQLLPVPAFSISNGILSIDLKKSAVTPGIYLIGLWSGDKCIGFSKIILNF
jgi:hypothetical protein